MTASGSIDLNVKSKDDDSTFRGAATLLTLAAIAGIAYADWIVAGDVSLGFLYLLPLAISALNHQLRATLFLAAVCVLLRQWLGPYEQFGGYLLARTVISLAVLFGFLIIVHRLGQQRQRLQKEVRRQRDQLLHELELAAAVQRRLLPQSVPQASRLDVAAWMLPVRGVAGDYYDFIEINDRRLVAVIGDVSGKGMAAALLMPAIWIALRLLAPNNSPREALAELNKLLYRVSDSIRFVTLFYADFDLENQVMRYVNAGHDPPLLVRSRSPETSPLDRGGTVVGLLPRVEYETAEVRLQSGDLLVLYTDGLVEIEDSEGYAFSPERLQKVVESHSRETAAKLLETIRRSVVEFAGSETFQDDVTLIVRRVPQ